MKRNKKSLMYYDSKTKNYVMLVISLRDDVKDTDINSFYNFLYAMKLDSGFSSKRTFSDTKSTGDLVQEFEKILESDIINLGGLANIYDMDLLANEYNYTEKSNENKVGLEDSKFNELAAKASINSFFDLFEITNKENYTDCEIDTIIRQTKYRALSKSDENTISKLCSELEAVKENTKFIYTMAKNNILKVNSKNNIRNIAFAK